MKHQLCVALLMLSVSFFVIAEHPDDPWEPFNRKIYSFNTTLDVYFLKPVAKGYQAVTPDIVDSAITNVFNNFGDVVSLVNSILQFKIKDAVSTAGRITFNTTFGLGGLIDVSTGFGLPAKNEDFGQTLNHWGLPQGNYLVLPFLGPATVSAAVGMVPDRVLLDPVDYLLASPETYYATGLNVIDVRADLLAAENLAQGDRYAFLRSVYLQRREFLINDGRVESDPFLNEEDFDDF